MTFRFHVVGLPHAPTTKEHCACAYVSKVLKFCKMMTELGHEVIHYGVEGSNPVCSRHVNILSREEHQEFFGGHDYRKTYYPIVWDDSLPYWRLTNTKAAYWIKKNHKPKDFVCVIGGLCNQSLAKELSPLPIMTVEYGIGYYGTFAAHRAFESYAHMHHCYGRESKDPDGKFFDAVIPNYFDLGDFSFHEKPLGCPRGLDPLQGGGENREAEPYCLFMGRMIHRKGISIAVEATRRAKMRLLLCGQGVAEVDKTGIHTEDGATYVGDHLEYVGFADTARRNLLMGNATVLLAPTLYLEPFGGVVVEAALSGTPAIASDWGAFSETIDHGRTGYRCRTIEQFEWALRNVSFLDRNLVRAEAKSRYSLAKVGVMFEEWFGMLNTLWGDGFNAVKDRQQLSWLVR